MRAIWRQNATRRLLRDLKEVLEHPLPNVVARPLENDLFTWHGNGHEDSQFQHEDETVPFHFLLSFPEDYPSSPPKVGLYTQLPHPNIHQRLNTDSRGPQWRLALWDCNPDAGEDGWLCTYTVYTILVQLQAFLIAEDMMWHTTQVTLPVALLQAANLVIHDCPHTGADPWPPFPTENEIRAAEELARRRKAAVTAPVPRHTSAPLLVAPMRSQSGCHVQMPGGALYNSKDEAGRQSGAPTNDTEGNAHARKGSSLENDVWQEVHRRKGQKSTPQSHGKPMQPSSRINLTALSTASAVGATSRATGRGSLPAAIMGITSPSEGMTSRTATGVSSDLEGKSHAELIGGVMEAAEAARRSLPACQPQVIADERSANLGFSAGKLADLPCDAMFLIICQLKCKDIACLSMTCKGMEAACNEAHIWQSLLDRDFAGAHITAARASDWKHAYLVQKHDIVDTLQCFFTRASHNTDVLGLPLFFDRRPRKPLQFIQVHPELLSLAAFRQGVNRAPGTSDSQGNIAAVIPLYLTEEHFQRALPLFPDILKELSPHLRNCNVLPAKLWLDVCAKIMHTAVLQLVEHGVSASEKAITTYCLVHRLLLALSEHYELWKDAAQRLDSFLSGSSGQTKAACPDLGLLILMLTVSPKHTWVQLVVPLLLESFNRGVLWVCRGDESLVRRYSRPEGNGGADHELNARVFQLTRISRGLLAFHAAFLHYIACPQASQTKRPSKLGISGLYKVMNLADSLYGRPGAGQVKRLQAAFQEFQAADTWQKYFRLIGITLPATTCLPAYVSKQLRRSWHNSLANGYHKKGMSFGQVTSRAVPKILHKCESYPALPAMNSLEIVNVYKYAQSMSWLDVSLLVYRPNGTHLCTVDWETKYSVGTTVEGAINYAEDMTDRANHSGRQGATINLLQLGWNVKDVYVVVSAWAGDTLGDIKQPHVMVKDCGGRLLCEYHTEDKGSNELSNSTCVVLCCIHRCTKTAGAWVVEAVGKAFREGSASNYAPIHAWITSKSSDR